ncbi:MAG: CaiB/BaiF CoA transferase family protein [Actinomycetota bacterium]|nr:CoA transferase [Actinomycetota bacterium]
MSGALDGIRVLDLGTRIGAPFAATLLAELGADVIKIEQPGTGDFMRTVPPLEDGVSLWWAVDGRGKRSVTLDLSTPQGQDLLRRLAAKSDVLVENFQPGTLEKWNLAPEDLKKINPRLIVSRVSVYGQDGPYKDRPGLDRNGIALGGLLAITGYADRPPVRPGVIIADYTTALFNSIGILAALFERERSEKGQTVELSLYESILRIMEWTVAGYDRLGIVRERTGNRLANSAPLDNYETLDKKYVCIAAAGDVLFPRLCKAMSREDLLSEARFANLDARAQNNDAINDIVAEWCKTRTLREIEEILARHHVPVSGVYSIDEIVADPHVQARNSIVTVDDPALGPMKQQAPTPRLDRTPLEIRRGAPRLGEHTDEVLDELLGIANEELHTLRGRGVI